MGSGQKDFCLFWVVALILRIGLAYAVGRDGVNPTLMGMIVIALLTPPIVRRLHDIGYSGWLTIGVIAIPYVSILLLLLPGEQGANAYGPNPGSKAVAPEKRDLAGEPDRTKSEAGLPL